MQIIVNLASKFQAVATMPSTNAVASASEPTPRREGSPSVTTRCLVEPCHSEIAESGAPGR
jgi:hypothetical protein